MRIYYRAFMKNDFGGNMKKVLPIVILAFSFSLFAGTPAIDGTFDGTGTWGSAVASADDANGFNNININELFVTSDDTYAYFAASFNTGGEPSDWMRAGFIINCTSGGGSSDPWGSAVSYGHTNKPDFLLIGRLGNGANWAEIRSWNGSSWDGGGTDVYDTDMDWAIDRSYIEGRISLSTLGSPSIGDVQFYVSGNNETEHGTFDACPDDEVMTSWKDPTTLDNFQTDVSLPVELSDFAAYSSYKGVKLTWTTDSEIENQGFNILRRSQAHDWKEIASFTKEPSLLGQGSTTEATEYYFIDTQVKDGWSYSYQLVDVDYQGKMTHHQDHIQTITYVTPEKDGKPAKLKVVKLYPNPFNPTVTLTYDLADMSDLNVSIYDVSGELVWNHVKADHPAGQNYTLTWNGADTQNIALPSGVYLVNIQAGTQVLSQKVTLLR